MNARWSDASPEMPTGGIDAMPKFPPRPPAPSVRLKVGAAIERSRTLSRDETPISRQEVVRDILAKLSLPPALQTHLRELHAISKNKASKEAED